MALLPFSFPEQLTIEQHKLTVSSNRIPPSQLPVSDSVTFTVTGESCCCCASIVIAIWNTEDVVRCLYSKYRIVIADWTSVSELNVRARADSLLLVLFLAHLSCLKQRLLSVRFSNCQL